MASRRPDIRRKTGPRDTLVVHLIKDLNLAPRTAAGEACSVTIRPMNADPGEVDAWLSIQNEAFNGRARPWTRADFDRELQQRSWFRANHLWLAQPAGCDMPVGTIALELEDRSLVGRIHWLAVRPVWQCQGIGRRLVEELEQECWQRGGRRIALETLGSWETVIRFYQSLGYREKHGNKA